MSPFAKISRNLVLNIKKSLKIGDFVDDFGYFAAFYVISRQKLWFIFLHAALKNMVHACNFIIICYKILYFLAEHFIILHLYCLAVLTQAIKK